MPQSCVHRNHIIKHQHMAECPPVVGVETAQRSPEVWPSLSWTSTWRNDRSLLTSICNCVQLSVRISLGGWVYTGFTPDLYQIHTGFIPDLYQIHTGFIPDSHWIHTGSIRSVPLRWLRSCNTYSSTECHVTDGHLAIVYGEVYWAPFPVGPNENKV